MAQRKRNSKGYIKKTFTYEGKRYYIYARNTTELIEKETQKRQELKEGAINRQNPTINAYYKYFTDIRQNNVKSATIRAQASQFKNIANIELAPGVIFGNLRINDITRKDIESLRMLLLNQGKTPENINICMAHLNHVFINAVNDDTIIKNPCKALKPLKRSTEPINETKHRALSQEETERFFKAAAERNSFYLSAFKMLLFTGLRIGELSALYKSDIDIKSGYLHIYKTVTRDNIGNYLIGETPKTEKGKRDIPINADILKAAAEQEQINKMFFGIDINNNIPLFRSSEGMLLKEYTINREIERICKLANIEKFTCHAFRNTFATRFIEQRPQDYKILSEILGHADIKITLNLYTHVMSENKINAMQDIKIKIG